jgi:hypothetical protein
MYDHTTNNQQSTAKETKTQIAQFSIRFFLDRAHDSLVVKWRRRLGTSVEPRFLPEHKSLTLPDFLFTKGLLSTAASGTAADRPFGWYVVSKSRTEGAKHAHTGNKRARWNRAKTVQRQQCG